MKNFYLLIFAFLLFSSVSAQPMLAHYPFWVDAGDVSGHGNNGTLNGGAAVNTCLLDLNGSSAYVSVPNNISLLPSNQISMYARIKPFSTTGSDMILQKFSSGTNKGYQLRLINGKVDANFGGTATTVTSSGTLTANQWHNVFVTYNGAQYKIYIDGVLDISGSAPNDLASTTALFIGSSSGSSDWFHGQIDDIRVYNYELSLAEMSLISGDLAAVPSLTISITLNPVCVGNTVAFFATPVNGGTNPIFEWHVNGTVVGGNASVFSYLPDSGDVVSCWMTSSLPCSNGTTAVSNSFTVLVYPLLVATANIPNPAPVCNGNGVTLFVNPTNGGLTPTFQWYKNGALIPLATQQSYTYVPINGDFLYCAVTSSFNCAIPFGTPVNSNTVTISVTENLTASVSILASANPICAGTPVTFTASAVNGGTSPSYQWKVNNVSVGPNSPSYTYAPATGDIVKCELLKDPSWTCVIGGNPATSNFITMNVSPLSPVSVSISTPSTTICSSSPVTFTANAVNPGASPVYTWKVNGITVGGNQATYSYTPANNDQVQCFLTNNTACATGSPAASNVIFMTVTGAAGAVGISIVANSASICLGSSITYTATPATPGASPSYVWNINGNPTAPSNSNTYTYTPGVAANVVVFCTLTSSLGCASNNPATSNSVTVTVSNSVAVGVSISTPTNPVCAGTSVTFTANPSNPGPLPLYSWTVNNIAVGSGTSYTYVPLNGDQVRCILTSLQSCATNNPATSNVVTMNVTTQQTVSVSITTPSTSLCTGSSASFTAIPGQVIASPVYQWYKNGSPVGTNSTTYTYTPVLNGDAVYCVLSSVSSCSVGSPATSSTITMSVSASSLAAISISASALNICQGTTVTFTAVAANGGSSPLYNWTVDNNATGTNSTTLSITPSNGQTIRCILTSNSSCATGSPVTSNAIVIGVNPTNNVSLSITASANNICQGIPVTFTAFPVNQGSSPQYQWTVNGVLVGGNTTTYTYLPTNADVISCSLISSTLCSNPIPATSNPLTMNITSGTPVSVSISASTNNVCPGTPITFTATAIGGGTPSYQWKVNGINAGINSPSYTYNPANNDQVSCIVTSNASCALGNPATSNTIVMSVNTALPVSVAITANPGTIVCAGTAINFTATVVNGGGSPNYQWKINGSPAGSNSPVFNYANPTNYAVITCTVTSSLGCVTNNPAISNSLTMDVSSFAPVNVYTAASGNSVCAGTTVNFTATPSNGGASPVYQWKVNGVVQVSTSALLSYIPANGDIVTCRLTSSLLCTTGNPATSSPITMIVNPGGVVASVNITASSTSVCAGTAVNFTATPANGGATPSYQWKKNGSNVGSNTPIYSYTPLASGDIITCVMTSTASCATGSPATSNAVTITVNPATPVTLSISTSATNVCPGSTVTFTATTANGGTSPVFQWKVNGVNMGSNSPSFSYIASNNDVVSCVLTSNAPCATGSPVTSNSITISVMSNLPVSVTVSATSTVVCQGTSVTFTANPTNGGPGASYQWKVNGVNAGINNQTYTYQPAPGDVVSCQLTSSFTCVTGNPALSAGLPITVNSNVPVSVGISTSATNICPATLVTLTAIPVNPGTLPVYQWKVNGVNVGSNSATHQYYPSNGDHIVCVLTSNSSCASGSPAISNAIDIVVVPFAPVSVTVTPNTNSVCPGTNVTFTANVTNPGTAPTYVWRVGSTVVGGNTPTYSYTPLNADLVSCTVTSNLACASSNPASNSVTMIVVSSSPVSVAITPSANPLCAGSPVTFTANPANGGASPSYQWKLNGSNAGTNSATYTYTPLNNDVITCVATSSLTCVTGNPATSAPVSMTVNPILPTSISITTAATSLCVGESATFTANPLNGGSNPQYQWKVNGTNYSTTSSLFYTPVNGDQVQCFLTSNASCPATNPTASNLITMTVNPMLPAALAISPSLNNVCSGTAVTYTASPSNGGSNPVYNWSVNGAAAGTSSPTLTLTPNNGDYISCMLTSNATCVTGSPTNSNTVVMVVNQSLTVALNITATLTSICQGTPVTFNAFPTNGGAAPVYQWKVNGVNNGTNSASFTFAPNNNDVISCVLNSNALCATGNPAVSNSITISVGNSLPVSVSISASASVVCSGISVTYTANPVNGGTSAFYQWKVNGTNAGINNPVFVYTPQPGETISCVLTSSNSCTSGNPATSNGLTVTVNQNVWAAVTISASANTVCAGTAVTFVATPTDAGASPTYLWKVNGIPTGSTGSTFVYTPTNGQSITCLMTPNGTCTNNSTANSNTQTITVTPSVPVSVSISPSANPVCTGTSVTFSASPTNGGSNPVYQWFKNSVAVGSGPGYTYSPLNGDQVYVTMTSNVNCASGSPASSSAVTMTVNASQTASVSIAASANPVCSGTTVTFTATPVQGGSSPVYQWYKNTTPVGSGATYSYIPANNDQVYVVLTSNAQCVNGSPATSSTINMTVNASVPASVSIAPSANPVCAGTGVTFTATPVNGGSLPTYQWFKNGASVSGATSVSYSLTPANGDQVYVVMTSNTFCAAGNPATSATTTMTVNPLLTASVTITANANPVCAGTTVGFTATPTNGGANPLYQWYKNSIAIPGANAASYSFVPDNWDLVYVIMNSNAACVTGSPAISPTIVMTVNPLLPASVTINASANPVCAGTSVTFTASTVNGGLSPTYQWYKNSSLITGANSASYSYIPSNGDLVYVLLTSNALCVSGSPATSANISMIVNPSLAVSTTIAANPNPVCAGTIVTLSTSSTNGGSNPVYQWYKNNVAVTGATTATFNFTPVNGDQIYVSLTSNANCATGNPANSSPISMQVNPLQPVSVVAVADANPVCSGTSVTFNANPGNGGSTPVYQWYKNGVAVSGAINNSFTYTPASGDQVYVVLTSNALCASTNPASSSVITMGVNPALPVSVSLAPSANAVCSGTSVNYTATPINGGSSPVYQWYKNNVLIVGANNATYSYVPANGDQIYVVLTSNASCAGGSPATSATVNMTVNAALAVSVGLNVNANPVCPGTAVNFTASPVNGGTSPSFQWYKNGALILAANSASYSYTPGNNDQIYVVMASNAVCASGSPASSATIVMSVSTSQVASVANAVNTNPVCSGTSVNFTATPTNGGTTPTYQWYKNTAPVTGANSATYTYTPANGDQVYVKMTSNAGCASGSPANSLVITMTVNPAVPASVSIAPNANPVCAGTTVMFTATPTNGGPTPGYQWYKNSIAVTGANSSSYSFIPVNGDQVYTVMTSSANCASGSPATSAGFVLTVNPAQPAAVSATVNANPVCTGTSVSFTATPTNGGTSPVYQWYKNSSAITGANGATYSYTPINGDQVYVTMTSNAACASGNPASATAITMTVNTSLPAAVSVVVSANPVCSGTTVSFTATPANGGSAPVYQWFKNGSLIAGANGTTYAYTPVNGDIVHVMMTSNAGCASGSPASSTGITMTVNALLPVSISAAASANPLCAGSSVTFTATPTNGGTTPVYQWFKNGVLIPGANLASYSYIPINGDQVYISLTSNALCTSTSPVNSATINMTVNPALAVSVLATASSNPVCTGTAVTYTATPSNGGTSPAYQWYKNGVALTGENNATYTYIPANGNQIYVSMTSNANCVTGNPASSSAIVMVVNSSLPASVSIAANANPVCSGTAVIFTASPVNGGTTPSYQWYKNTLLVSGATSATYSYTPGNGDQVYVKMTSNSSCATGSPASSAVTTVIVNAAVTLSVQTLTNICLDTVPFTLNTVSPAGGTYTGTGIANNVFSPAIAGSGTTTYTYAYASPAGCQASTSGSLGVSLKSKIQGYVHYDNVQSSVVDSVKIVLKTLSNVLLDSVNNNTAGFYGFECLNNATYKLDPNGAKKWGGANASDALLIAKFSVGLQSLTPFRQKVGDVNLSGFVNALDAHLITKRFIGLLTSFPADDWIFQSTSPLLVNPTATYTQNLLTCCAGDVDASYYFPSKKSTIDPNDDIITGSNFSQQTIPVYVSSPEAIHAISMAIPIPENIVIKSFVSAIPGAEAGIYNGELRFAWFSIDGITAVNPTEILSLVVEVRDLSSGDKQLITWPATFEIANENGIAVEEARLNIPGISIDQTFQLSMEYANPISDRIDIFASTPADGYLEMKLINEIGQEVAILYSSQITDRQIRIARQISDVPQGLYFITAVFTSPNAVLRERKKVIIIQ